MALPSFSHVDVTSIAAFATLVQKKTAFGPIPDKLRVGGQDIPTWSVAPEGSTNCPLAEEDFRALYSDIRREIQLQCAGVTLMQTANALGHIICVVGHEALHAIQRQCFSDDQIKNASSLGKKAGDSALAYEEYVGCDVELPAHAVMVALELRQQDPTGFDKAARTTSIYRYIASRLNGAPTANDVLGRLVAAATEMHTKMRPPGPGDSRKASQPADS